MAQVPRTRYAQCGDIDIAYQVFGDGPVDLVVLPGPFIPIDSIDAEPSMYRFYRRLASFARVIRFDQRGMGLSSRLPSVDAMGPKFWAEDAIAVMDAVGCEQATLFGSNFFSMSGLVLAADYPERVRSLVIVNGAARVLWAPDYEVGVQASTADPYSSVAMEPDAVEQGFGPEIVNHSLVDDHRQLTRPSAQPCSEKPGCGDEPDRIPSYGAELHRCRQRRSAREWLEGQRTPRSLRRGPGYIADR